MKKITREDFGKLRREGKVDRAELKKVVKSKKPQVEPKPDKLVMATEAIGDISKDTAASLKALNNGIEKIGQLVENMKPLEAQTITIEKPMLDNKQPKKWKLKVNRDKRLLIDTVDVEVVGYN